MSKSFSRTFRVRWSAINAIGQVELSEFFRYVIETAWDWGASIGLSIEQSEQQGFAWVIRETEVNLYRSLCPNDVFELTIWLAEWRRVHGTRCFEIALKDGGEIVAQGIQEVVSLDGKTLRPVATPEQVIADLRLENPRIFPHRKIPKYRTIPENAFVIQRVVEWRDLDLLEHVNNANYASFAEDATLQALAAAGWSPSRFKAHGLSVLNKRVQIKYHAPAVWGEKLDVAAYLVELLPNGGTWYVDMRRSTDGEAVVECIIEWSAANRMSADEQRLPNSLSTVLNQRIGIAGMEAV